MLSRGSAEINDEQVIPSSDRAYCSAADAFVIRLSQYCLSIAQMTFCKQLYFEDMERWNWIGRPEGSPLNCMTPLAISRHNTADFRDYLFLASKEARSVTLRSIVL